MEKFIVLYKVTANYIGVDQYLYDLGCGIGADLQRAKLFDVEAHAVNACQDHPYEDPVKVDIGVHPARVESVSLRPVTVKHTVHRHP
jgi:hypothetical protein